MGRKESIRSEPEEEPVPEPEPEPITYGKGSFSFVDSSVYGRYERPSRTTAVGAHYGYRLLLQMGITSATRASASGTGRVRLSTAPRSTSAGG